MNNQIPGYSAVYGGQPSAYCPMCQQPVSVPTAEMPAQMMTQQQAAAPSLPTPSMTVQFAQGTETSLPQPLPSASQPMPLTADSTEYLNGFLRTQIGRRVRVEFLLGTNTFTDKSGLLIGVGANYILLREASSDDIMACDFYNIKFITLYF